jgi:hypothetical protein
MNSFVKLVCCHTYTMDFEMVVSSNSHAGVVPTTIVHPTMVGGLNDLVLWVPKKALGGE